MKNIILLLSIILSFSQAEEITKTFNIKGMMCGMSCPAKVKETTVKLDGVKACDVSYEKSSAVITFDTELISENTIAKTITDHTYYKVELVNEKKSFWDKLFNKN